MKTDKPPEEFCYVALHSCGGWQGLTVDSEQALKDNAKHLARWVRWGLTIERWPIERVRKEAISCKCFKKPKQKTLIANAGA